MAADTAARRRSAMLIMQPYRGTAYPQASIDAEERAAVMFLYAGIPGGSPAGTTRRYGLLVLGVG